jgi:hypothetical protein
MSQPLSGGDIKMDYLLSYYSIYVRDLEIEFYRHVKIPKLQLFENKIS